MARVRRISVTVVPRSRAARIERTGKQAFRVSVTAPPHEGQANAAVVDALAEHFRIARSRIRIVRGATGRHKLIEIDPPPGGVYRRSPAGTQ